MAGIFAALKDTFGEGRGGTSVSGMEGSALQQRFERRRRRLCLRPRGEEELDVFDIV